MEDYYVMVCRRTEKPEVYRANEKVLPFVIEGMKQDKTVFAITAWIDVDNNEISIEIDPRTKEWHNR
jgi:hypothetical protein